MCISDELYLCVFQMSCIHVCISDELYLCVFQMSCIHVCISDELYLCVFQMSCICVCISDDHKMLVEPSCGAGLTAVYSGLIGKLVREGRLGTVRTAVIVVCGGGIATLELLQKWKTDVGL